VEIQSKKPHQSNWEHKEVVALIQVKKKEHLVTFDRRNLHNLFQTNIDVFMIKKRSIAC
jgi:hypothetical protein